MSKKTAAETEVNWEGAGSTAGTQIWRIENIRDEFGNPKVSFFEYASVHPIVSRSLHDDQRWSRYLVWYQSMARRTIWRFLFG